MDMQIFAASVGTRLCNGDNMGTALRSAALNHESECAAVKVHTDGVYSATRAGYFDVEPMNRDMVMHMLFAVQPPTIKHIPSPEPESVAEAALRPSTWRERLAGRIYNLIAGRD